MGRTARRGWTAIALVATAVLTVGCGGGPVETGPPPEDTAVTVGSFDFGESQLLGEIYAQALEAAGFPVIRAFDVGPRELVLPALEQGLIDVLPEYAGSSLAFLGGAPIADLFATMERLRDAVTSRGLVALEASPAANTNVFAVTASTAVRLGLNHLSELVPFAEEMTFGGPPECQERPLCLQGLEDRYDLRFEGFLALDAGGPLTVQALDEGQVDVALLFSTSERLRSGQLVPLEDDLELQPAENIVPIVSASAMARWEPGLEDALDTVSAALTTSALRVMNASLQRGIPPAQVAAAWLAAVPSGEDVE